MLCQRRRDRSETIPHPFRARSKTISAQASRPRWFAHRPEAQFTHSASVFCILHESAAPATKSIPDLAKVLRLPRNSNLTKPSRGGANGPVAVTVPRPFRTRSAPVPRPPPYRRHDRGGLRTVRKPNSRTAPAFSASYHSPTRRECIQSLGKVARLPRNL